MTVTLDDVGTILEIPLTSSLVSADTLSAEMAVDLVSSQLGSSPEDAHDRLASAQGMSMRLEWLRGIFGQVSDAHLELNIRSATRAFLLYIFGYTLFTDKSNMWVPVTYCSFLQTRMRCIHMPGVCYLAIPV